MACLVMNKCCFCCSLQCGSKAIAIWSLISVILSIILSALVVTGLSVLINRKDEDQAKINFFLALAAIDIASLSLQLIFTVLLIVGIYKEIPRYIKAYVILQIIYLMLAFALACASILGHQWIQTLLKFVVLVLNTYWTVVIYCYYKKLIEDQEFPPRQYV